MAHRPMEAAGTVDAQNAPTAPWKTAQNAVSHSYHRRSHRESGTTCYPCSRLTLSPMFPAAQVYFQTSAPAWSRLNSVAAIFEYEVDAQGNSRAQLWEWK